MIINTAGSGNGFPWHFDTNNFTMTPAIQNAEDGGAFEYAPNIRKGSENFNAVSKVLDGASDKARMFHLEPGDLQLFRERCLLHRVVPLRGHRARHVAILSNIEAPGMVAPPKRCKQFYGRVLPIHFERAGLRQGAYLD